MRRRKKLKELTIKDNFLFGAVMVEEENCKQLLELTLGFSIDHVEVSKEKSMIYHLEYKGVRLDVYAKDENNTRYNVETQVARKAGHGDGSLSQSKRVTRSVPVTLLSYAKKAFQENGKPF